MANWAKLKSIAAGDVSKIVGFPDLRVQWKDRQSMPHGKRDRPTARKAKSWLPRLRRLVVRRLFEDQGCGHRRGRRDVPWLAIVCREYGLPAVVGTGSRYFDPQVRQRIRIDGSTGEIVIIS